PAIPIATGLAQALSARVCFVHAVPTPAIAPCPTGLYLPWTMREVFEREVEEATASLQEVEAGCRARGIWARSYVGRGGLAWVLDEAAQTRADLLVMVTRTAGPRDACSGGRVTPQLLDTPGPPLLLVRAGAEPTPIP
ncbi:MAG: universal stress protein, partial [Candidatus Methylomirabilales bacterium]